MKLNAFTLIEGIVSMVLLSIMLSVAILVTYNLYRSFPSERKLMLQSILDTELDSLAGIRQREPLVYQKGPAIISYRTSKAEGLDHVFVAECNLKDTLDMELKAKKVFYVPE